MKEAERGRGTSSSSGALRLLGASVAVSAMLAAGAEAKPRVPAETAMPTLASVVEREGWTPTPTQSNIYRPGVILVPDGATHLVVANNCVDAEPDVQVLSETRIASSLRAGVRGGMPGVSASGEGSIIKQLTFVDPEQRTIPLIDLMIKPECRAKLASAAKRYDITNAIVVHDVLVAVIKSTTCKRVDAVGRVSALGSADASALTECVSESPGQVAVGYKALPLRSVAQSELTPAEPTQAIVGPDPSVALRANQLAQAERERAAQEASRQAAADASRQAAAEAAREAAVEAERQAAEAAARLEAGERARAAQATSRQAAADAARQQQLASEQAAALERADAEAVAALRQCLLRKRSVLLERATLEWARLTSESAPRTELRDFVARYSEVTLTCTTDFGTRSVVVTAPEVELARGAMDAPVRPVEPPVVERQTAKGRGGPRTLHQVAVDDRPLSNDWSVGGSAVMNDPFLSLQALNASATLRPQPAFGVQLGLSYFLDLGEGNWKPLATQLVTENSVSPDISKLSLVLSAAFAFEPLYLEGPKGTFSAGINVGGAFVRTTDDLTALGAEDDELAKATQFQTHPAIYRQIYADVAASDGWGLRLHSQSIVFVETVKSTNLEIKNNLIWGVSIIRDGRQRR